MFYARFQQGRFWLYNEKSQLLGCVYLSPKQRIIFAEKRRTQSGRFVQKTSCTAGRPGNLEAAMQFVTGQNPNQINIL